MTLEQVRVFVAVAERQHVTRAAEALNIAQSAVSASIAVLEGRHGAKLFNRVGRRIELTEAGALFLTEARAVLARAESADTIGFRACSWGAQPFAPRASSCPPMKRYAPRSKQAWARQSCPLQSLRRASKRGSFAKSTSRFRNAAITRCATPKDIEAEPRRRLWTS
jgi:DNA-binding MarR family transcriptional regulator